MSQRPVRGNAIVSQWAILWRQHSPLPGTADFHPTVCGVQQPQLPGCGRQTIQGA